jgi:hypothetical protein
MRHNESKPQRTTPPWAVVTLTVVSFASLMPVIYYLSVVILSTIRIMIHSSSDPLPEGLRYLCACFAIGSSVLISRRIRRRIRGGKTAPNRPCPSCGYQPLSPGDDFCPQCDSMVNGVMRFFSFGDWVMAALNLLVMWWLATGLAFAVLAVGGVPSFPPHAATALALGLLVSVGNVAQVLRKKVRKRRTEFQDRCIKKGVRCPCGYNLTGNVSGTCPECGTPLEKPPASRA